MDFSKLSKAEYIEFLSANGYTNIPDDQLGRSAAYLFQESAKNNYATLRLTPAIIALDRSVRFPDAFCRNIPSLLRGRPDKKQLPKYYMSSFLQQVDQKEVLRLANNLSIDPKTPNLKNLIFRVAQLQGVIRGYYHPDLSMEEKLKLTSSKASDTKGREVISLISDDSPPSILGANPLYNKPFEVAPNVINIFDREEIFRNAMLAIQNNDVKSLEHMLDSGLDVNLTKDFDDKRTLLWFATTNLDITDRRQVIDLLLSRGANPNILANGETPLSNLISTKNELYKQTLVDMINKYNGDIRSPVRSGKENMLTVAVDAGSIPLVQYLLRAGLNPNGMIDPKEKPYKTIFYTPIMGKNEHLIDVLLDFKADPDLKDRTGTSGTSLTTEMYEDAIQDNDVEDMQRFGQIFNLLNSKR